MVSSDDPKQIAAQYLKDQADIIRLHGDSPVSGPRYTQAVNAAKKTFEAMLPRGRRPDPHS